jgi:hypothetical protein
MSALDVIKSQNFTEINKLFKRPVFKVAQADAIKQYHIEQHDIFDTVKRPYRKISRDTGRKDSNDNPIRQDILVDVVRVGISWQDTITETRVGFILSNPVTTNVIWDTESNKEKQLVNLVEKIQNDNKMDYKNKEILRRKLSELEVAEIWYFIDQGEGEKPRYTLRCKIVSPELGDTLYPLFDKNGSLIAFRRDYVLNDGQKDVSYSDVYTDEFEYKYINQQGWKLDPNIVAVSKETGELIPKNPVPNIAGKMLINYYQQTEPCWSKVQSMISRHETLISNHGGMNDKFGNPLFVVSGEIQGEIIDNTTGSVMQMENGATAQYAELSSEPQSISLEITNLERFIRLMSKTPDMSIQAMASIGNVASASLEIMLNDPHIAVRNEEESFGIGLQRRLNIIKPQLLLPLCLKT